MRTIIDLREGQLERQAGVCAREGISRAEAIRRAVSAERERNEKSNAEENLAAVIGMCESSAS